MHRNWHRLEKFPPKPCTSRPTIIEGKYFLNSRQRCHLIFHRSAARLFVWTRLRFICMNLWGALSSNIVFREIFTKAQWNVRQKRGERMPTDHWRWCILKQTLMGDKEMLERCRYRLTPASEISLDQVDWMYLKYFKSLFPLHVLLQKEHFTHSARNESLPEAIFHLRRFTVFAMLQLAEKSSTFLCHTLWLFAFVSNFVQAMTYIPMHILSCYWFDSI